MASDILIVDDEADIREGVSGILSDEGHNTRTAKNSDEALAAIEARRPQLIFLDIWMQGSRLDGMQLLGFAHVGGGDVELTAAGKAFSNAEMDERKAMFGNHLLRNVPLAAHIQKVLQERPNHRAPAARFLSELEDHMSEEWANDTLERLINWGRYAELFAYDYDTETFRLEDPEQG